MGRLHAGLHLSAVMSGLVPGMTKRRDARVVLHIRSSQRKREPRVA